MNVGTWDFVMKLEPTEAAYLAGLLDGEGCIMLSRHVSDQNPMGFVFRTRVELMMCDEEVIRYIAALTGGRAVKSRTLPSGRTAYGVQWTDRFAAELIRNVLPFLRGKREQAQLLLHFHESVAPGRGRAYKADDLVACNAIWERMKALKKPDTLRC